MPLRRLTRGRRYKLVAGAEGDRFNSLLVWAESWEPTAPTIVPEASRVTAHVWEPTHEHRGGVEAASIIDTTPGENGLALWR